MSAKDNKLDQIIKTIDANDIKFLKLQFSDIHGLPKSMAVPLKKADDVEDIVAHLLSYFLSYLPDLCRIRFDYIRSPLQSP
mgnify:CR=1 FL=1